MVEFGNSWYTNEEFDDLLGILDFPMESLEGDELAGDWDISNLQLPGFLAPIDGQLSNHIGASTSHIHPLNKLVNAQDSGAFKTQSPVSVLEKSGSYLGGTGFFIKSNNVIPVRSRSKRVRPVGANPWLLASPEFSTSQKAQRRNESKKSLQHPSAMDFMKDSPQKVENLKTYRPRKCFHCESTKTPQWRDGPKGPKTLCNACGVRYRTGRLFPEYRPANSPSFTPSKHSNSHKKIIEMRNKEPAGIIKITEQKQLPNRVGASTSHVCQQSPVSVLESRCKRARSAVVYPSLLASKTLNTTSKATLQMAKDPELESISKRVTSAVVYPSLMASKSLNTTSKATLQMAKDPELESISKRVRSAVVYPSLMESKPLNTTSKETLQMAKDPELQQLSNHIAASTSVNVPQSGAFKTQTPFSLLESKDSILVGKSSSIEHDNAIPVQSRKLVTPTRLNQSFSSELSTSQKTLNTKRSKEGKKKEFQHLAAMNILPIKVEAISDLGHEQNRPLVNKMCAHCETTKTPQWREGPMGLLCNACGVCYKKGRLFPEYRPADSPTFVPSMHSNFHSRIIGMRNKAKQLVGEITVTPISTQQEVKTEQLLLSPQPEFVPMSSYFFDYIK